MRSALDGGTGVESLYVAPEGDADRAAREVCRQAQDAGIRVFPLAAGVMERVADTVTPQPVLAVVPMLDDPGPTAFEAAPSSLVVVMVDVRDPGNAGTVLRAADAAGVRCVFFAGDSVYPYNPKTVRSSAGSLFHVPFAVRSDASALAADLRSAGVRTLGTVVRDGEDYAQVDWDVPSALFLGNESAGLDPELCATLEGRIAVPMEGRAESLNVGIACAVVCFEALRQRRSGQRTAPSISPGMASPPVGSTGGAAR